MYPIIIKNLAMVTGGISFISNTCTHKERKKQVRVRQKDKQNSKEKKIIKSRRKEQNPNLGSLFFGLLLHWIDSQSVWEKTCKVKDV